MNKETLMRKTLLDNGDIPASELAAMIEPNVYEEFNKRYCLIQVIDNKYRSYYANKEKRFIVVSREQLEALGNPITIEEEE